MLYASKKFLGGRNIQTPTTLTFRRTAASGLGEYFSNVTIDDPTNITKLGSGEFTRQSVISGASINGAVPVELNPGVYSIRITSATLTSAYSPDNTADDGMILLRVGRMINMYLEPHLAVDTIYEGQFLDTDNIILEPPTPNIAVWNFEDFDIVSSGDYDNGNGTNQSAEFTIIKKMVVTVADATRINYGPQPDDSSMAVFGWFDIPTSGSTITGQLTVEIVRGYDFFEDDNALPTTARSLPATVSLSGASLSSDYSKFGTNSLKAPIVAGFGTGTITPLVYPLDQTFQLNAKSAWTIEWWMTASDNTYQNNASGPRLFLFKLTGAVVKTTAYIVNDNQAYYRWNYEYDTSTSLDSGALFRYDHQPVPTWIHCALTNVPQPGFIRSTQQWFINGAPAPVANTRYNEDANTRSFFIGTSGGLSDINHSGGIYYNELRISNTIRYTGNFSVPTAPLTPTH
jgi:hypothetical protein